MRYPKYLSVSFLSAVLLLCIYATSASAAFNTVVQEDAILLNRDPDQVYSALVKMRDMGVTHVRMTAEWARYAPRKRQGSRPTDPRTYSHMEHLDRAVVFTRSLGMEPLLDIGFRSPKWGKNPDKVGPDAQKLTNFAIAIARRYNGKFRRVASEQPLPVVHFYTIHNEPNFPSYYTQWYKRKGKFEALSPHLYRKLVQLSVPAIKRQNPRAKVLIGGTSAYGNYSGKGKGPLAPLRFIREFACMSKSFKPMKTPLCRHFKKITADGWAHHPYTLRNQPDYRAPHSTPDDVNIADLSRMVSTLKRLVKAKRISASMANVWVTEFGYESNAQVDYKPWTEDQQARLLGEAEYVAYCTKGVRSYANFLLFDLLTQQAAAYNKQKSNGNYFRFPGAWQTGLFREDGRAKPSASAFVLPAVAITGPVISSQVPWWGRVRPAKAAQTMRFEVQDNRGVWQPLPTHDANNSNNSIEFQTRGDGIWRRSVAFFPNARYRVAVKAGRTWYPSISQQVLPHSKGSKLSKTCTR